jgi:hypothetical protein
MDVTMGKLARVDSFGKTRNLNRTLGCIKIEEIEVR